MPRALKSASHSATVPPFPWMKASLLFMLSGVSTTSYTPSGKERLAWKASKEYCSAITGNAANKHSRVTVIKKHLRMVFTSADSVFILT